MSVPVKGEVYPSKNYGDFVVVEYYNAFKVKIRFLSTGFERLTRNAEINNGSVKDLYHPTVYDKGYMGVGEFESKIDGVQNPAYVRWMKILERCYKPVRSHNNKAYEDCTVCDEWLNYQVFAAWFHGNNVEGYEVDKDMLVFGNKVYGPDACVFVHPDMNKLLTNVNDDTGGNPNGGQYSANINIRGDKVYIGNFPTRCEARAAYKDAKAAEVVRQALLPTTHKDLLNPLLDYAERIMK